MAVVQLDADWVEACLGLDQRALGGFWSATQWLSELADERRICLGLVRERELLGVACGWLVVDELHITVLAVDPMQRRQGYGLTLLQELLQRARLDGAVHATLEVAADNHAAINLYAHCHFRSAGRRERYYRDGRDALIQWRRLDENFSR